MGMLNEQLLLLVQLSVFISLVCGDAYHPVRFATEEEFFRAKTHERTFSLEEMNEKMDKMRKRQNFQAWNSKIPEVADILARRKVSGKRFPNILYILADDLGYGDLSVEPFTTKFDAKQWPCVNGGTLTPHLEKMAQEGVIMTNFHAAAPVCSPSRASIMTGFYSWRLNAMNAFEVSKEDPTQLNGFLLQVPTIAEILRDNGYFTGHSGKWHIGGMREENRKERVERSDCSVPGPNQHGFEEYVSALDGPESPRYSFLNKQEGLHTKGHRHRIKNDIPMPIIEDPNAELHVLSDYEANDGIALMKHAASHYPGQPWFIQVWFNAPHAPYELLLSGEQVYSERYNKTHDDWKKMKCNSRGKDGPLYNNHWFYKTMVSAMDKSIGRLFLALKEQGLDENTLVVFTSDNGPEWYAGSAGSFREGKRSLLEGGLRVPSIWRWKGVLPENAYSTFFGAHTDLLPTFLAAANASFPEDLKIDGVSLLPVLSKAAPVPAVDRYATLHNHFHRPSELIPGEKEIYKHYFEGQGLPLLRKQVAHNSSSFDISTLAAHNRVYLWHKACDPYGGDARRQCGGWFEHVKVLASNDGCIDRVFDLRHDPLETTNLLRNPRQCSLKFQSISSHALHLSLSNHYSGKHCEEYARLNSSGNMSDEYVNTDSEERCKLRYHAHLVKKVGIILNKLIPFFKFGKQGYHNYMSEDFKKGTCRIPSTSQVVRMRFTDHLQCDQFKYGCSEPEYPIKNVQ